MRLLPIPKGPAQCRYFRGRRLPKVVRSGPVPCGSQPRPCRRGTCSCPSEGRKQDEGLPCTLGTVLARSPRERRCQDGAPSLLCKPPI